VDTNKRVIARYEADNAAPSVHAAARMAKAAGASLDALAGLSAAGSDPDLARLLAQLAELPEADRAAIKRVIAGLVRLNQK
jgi:transcriptional regulator with XRE-family HTH domain